MNTLAIALSSRRWHRTALLIALIALVGLVAVTIIERQPERSTPSRVTWAFDVTDDDQLIDFATHVFFARVDSVEPGPPLAALPPPEGGEVDNVDGSSWSPTTVYAVTPVGDVKGDASALAEPVTVIQDAGINQRDELELVEGDSLLEIGQTYLVITKLDGIGLIESPQTDLVVWLVAPGFDHTAANTAEEQAELAARYGPNE